MGEQELTLPGESPEGSLSPYNIDWTWPIQQVQDWAQELWNTVLGAAEDVYEALASVVVRIGDWIIGVLHTAVDWVWDQMVLWFNKVVSDLTYWSEWLRDWLEQEVRWVNDRVAEWTTWVWNKVETEALWIRDRVTEWTTWVYDKVVEVGSTLVDDLAAAGSSLAKAISDAGAATIGELGSWGSALQAGLSELWGSIDITLGNLWSEVSTLISDTSEWVVEEIVDPWTDWLNDAFSGLTNILSGLAEAAIGLVQDAWRTFQSEVLGTMRSAVQTGVDWIQDWVGDQVDSFFDTLEGFSHQYSPMTPDGSYSAVRKLLPIVGIGVGGLAGMTLAGELMHPLKEMGFGHISAMIGDMTNYRMISGLFMGAFLGAMIRTPITYYFNKIFRPWMLSSRDFFLLMSRRAFTEPEALQNPALLDAINQVAGGDGAAFESSMIGYFGYPGEYMGFFKELAATRLGYFALAGIARTGFFEEKWFIEALHRTGYSDTAVEQLMKMYRIQATDARQAPVRSYLRYLHRDHFIATEEYRARMDEAARLEDFTEIRILASEYEREYRMKDDQVDMITRAYTRSILTESEAIDSLMKLGLPSSVAAQKILWEKLGMMKKTRIETPEPEIPFYIGFEYE